MLTQSEKLRQPAEFGRGTIARGLAAGDVQVDPQGGDFGAGVIYGFAVITRGPALGHDLWIDTEFTKQVAAALNASGGLKARFTHPGLSSDGMGKFLGRAKNAVEDGDVVRADLHLAASSRRTPDGDLGGYVLGLAAEDPAAFGASIVFEHDFDAEDEFENSHLEEVEETDWRGQPVKRMRFRSPDADNDQHFRHARLAQLRAVDAVDEPAANPEGFFRRGDQVANDAEQLLSFALGLSTDTPETSCFDVHPQRVQSFVAKFLERHKLTLASKEAIVPDPTAAPATTAPAAPTREQFTAELAKFTSHFGAEQGTQYFSEGKTFAEALELGFKELQTQLGKKDEEIKSLNEKLASIDRGEERPLSSSGAGNAKPAPAAEVKNTSGLPDGLAAFAAATKVPAKKN